MSEFKGKGSAVRPSSVTREELSLRDQLWRAEEKDKPELIKQITRLVEIRIANT